MPFTPATKTDAAVNSCPKLEPLIRKHGLPVKTFSELAWRESRCLSNAVGWNYKTGTTSAQCRKAPFETYLKTCKKNIKSFDSGYWQVNSTWYSLTFKLCGAHPQDGALFKGECNAKVTAYLYRDGGLSNWKR
jgi:hypothetical protein